MDNEHNTVLGLKLDSFIVTKIDFKIENLEHFELYDSLEFNFNYNFEFNEEDRSSYAIVYNLEVISPVKEVVSFRLVISAYAIYKLDSSVDNEKMDSELIKVYSPAFGFPFLRSFVNTLTVNAGLPPIILPALNFSELANSD